MALLETLFLWLVTLWVAFWVTVVIISHFVCGGIGDIVGGSVDGIVGIMGVGVGSIAGIVGCGIGGINCGGGGALVA